MPIGYKIAFSIWPILILLLSFLYFSKRKPHSFAATLFKISFFATSLGFSSIYLAFDSLNKTLWILSIFSLFFTAIFVLLNYLNLHRKKLKAFHLKLLLSLFFGAVISIVLQYWLATNNSPLFAIDFVVGLYLTLYCLGLVANLAMDYLTKNREFVLIPQMEFSEDRNKRRFEQLSIVSAYFFMFFLFIQGVVVWL